MQLLRAVRYLGVVGAAVVVFSYPLRWVVFTDLNFIVTGTHPPAILFLGLALVILSLIPPTGQLASILPSVLIGASVIGAFIILWSGIETVLQVVNLPAADLGPGPIVSLVGVALFVVGSIAQLQIISEETPDPKNYRVTGIQDSTHQR